MSEGRKNREGGGCEEEHLLLSKPRLESFGTKSVLRIIVACASIKVFNRKERRIKGAKNTTDASGSR